MKELLGCKGRSCWGAREIVVGVQGKELWGWKGRSCGGAKEGVRGLAGVRTLSLIKMDKCLFIESSYNSSCLFVGLFVAWFTFLTERVMTISCSFTFLTGRVMTIPCSYRSTCLYLEQKVNSFGRSKKCLSNLNFLYRLTFQKRMVVLMVWLMKKVWGRVVWDGSLRLFALKQPINCNDRRRGSQ